MAEHIYAEIAARIRRRRREQGLTLEELAHRSGMTTSYLGQVERAERKPSLHTVAAVAKGLGLPLAALLDGSAAAPAPSSPGRELEALLRGASEESRAAALETVRLVLRLMRRRARRA